MYVLELFNAVVDALCFCFLTVRDKAPPFENLVTAMDGSHNFSLYLISNASCSADCQWSLGQVGTTVEIQRAGGRGLPQDWGKRVSGWDDKTLPILARGLQLWPEVV